MPAPLQVEYCAPGIGNVQVRWKGNDPRGTLDMVEYNLLEGADLETARAAAVALGARAYDRSDPCARTTPLEAC